LTKIAGAEAGAATTTAGNLESLSLEDLECSSVGKESSSKRGGQPREFQKFQTNSSEAPDPEQDSAIVERLETCVAAGRDRSDAAVVSSTMTLRDGAAENSGAGKLELLELETPVETPRETAKVYTQGLLTVIDDDHFEQMTSAAAVAATTSRDTIVRDTDRKIPAVGSSQIFKDMIPLDTKMATKSEAVVVGPAKLQKNKEERGADGGPLEGPQGQFAQLVSLRSPPADESFDDRTSVLVPALLASKESSRDPSQTEPHHRSLSSQTVHVPRNFSKNSSELNGGGPSPSTDTTTEDEHGDLQLLYDLQAAPLEKLSPQEPSEPAAAADTSFATSSEGGAALQRSYKNRCGNDMRESFSPGKESSSSCTAATTITRSPDGPALISDDRGREEFLNAVGEVSPEVTEFFSELKVVAESSQSFSVKSSELSRSSRPASNAAKKRSSTRQEGAEHGV